jgi:hypothetical protein
LRQLGFRFGDEGADFLAEGLFLRRESQVHGRLPGIIDILSGMIATAAAAARVGGCGPSPFEAASRHLRVTCLMMQ